MKFLFSCFIYLFYKNKYKDLLIVGNNTKFSFSTKIHIFNSKSLIVIGSYSTIRGELLTFGHAGIITIGDYCYIGANTRVWSASRINIGNRVLISHQVNIFDNLTHPISAKLRHEQFKEICFFGFPKESDLSEKDTNIMDDVLIGCASVILRGVTIGTGAIVGAGSVVTKDVPPWTIVAGNPARVIREIPENER